jgi:hypothetical protein
MARSVSIRILPAAASSEAKFHPRLMQNPIAPISNCRCNKTRFSKGTLTHTSALGPSPQMEFRHSHEKLASLNRIMVVALEPK